MRETELINIIRKLAARAPQPASLLRGIGDDCAILRPNARPTANEDLVFTSDLLLEGRHFTRPLYSPADIGHKALARSLSDLAAMGAEPVFCLVSLAIPAAEDNTRFVRAFYRGLLALAAKYNCALAGGDLAQSDRIVVDVTCCGRVPRGKALLRSGAKPGDRIYVTGKLGKDWRRYRRPQPRIEAGVALRALGASAAIDLSDGLSLDLRRLCIESRVSAELTAPLSDAALHAGEDYELLFTAPSRLAPKLPAALPLTGSARGHTAPGHTARAARTLPIVTIGVITPGHYGRIMLNGRPLAPRAFDHFAR